MLPNFDRIKEIAFATMEKSITGRCWHMSIILNKSRIISIGFNNYFKTHPKIKEYGYHPHSKLHAELAACLRLGLTDCRGLTIVNIRISREMKITNSKFCNGCSNLIKSLNFSEAYHTDNSGNFVEYKDNYV